MPSDPFTDPFAEKPEPASARKGKGGKSAKGGLKNMGETAPIQKLENMGETGAHTLENFGETGATQLEHMGETGAHTLDESDAPRLPPSRGKQPGRGRTLGETGPMALQNFGDTGKTEELKNFGDTAKTESLERESLENFGETGQNRLENFGDTGKTDALQNFGDTGRTELENFGETGRNEALQNFGETGRTEGLQNFGETGRTQGLANFGDTGETKSLSNLGDTGAVHDPFAASGRYGADDPFSGSGTIDDSRGGHSSSQDATMDEPPSQPALRGADEENTYVVVGDHPEPDSQPSYLHGSGSRGMDGDDTAAESRGGSGGFGDRSADEEAAPTVDLPGDSLANLGRAGFADDPSNMQKGGSESMTMGADADDESTATRDMDPEDLRRAGASSLHAGDASGETTADTTGPEGETRDEPHDGDETADTSDAHGASDEAEPDFLYGERFSEKYAIPEAPVQEGKRSPLAIIAVLLLLAAAGGAYWKFVVDVEEQPGTGVGVSGATGGTSSVGVVKPPTGPTGTSAASGHTGTTGGTGLTAPNLFGQTGPTGGPKPPTGVTSSTATIPKNDEPLMWPAATNPVDAKLQRALEQGLPLQHKGGLPLGGSPGASPGTGTGTGSSASAGKGN